MTIEHSPEQTKNEQIDWEKYPIYQQFIQGIGGPQKIIPMSHVPSLVIRVHYMEYARLLFGDNFKMTERTARNIEAVDRATGFSADIVKIYQDASPKPQGSKLEEYTAGKIFKNNSLLTSLDDMSIKSLRERNITQVLQKQTPDRKFSLVPQKIRNFFARMSAEVNLYNWIDTQIEEEAQQIGYKVGLIDDETPFEPLNW